MSPVAGKRLWLVLPDPFPTRVFVDCGIVEKLARRLPGRVEVVLALPADEAAEWVPRLGDVPWTLGANLFPREAGHETRGIGSCRGLRGHGVELAAEIRLLVHAQLVERWLEDEHAIRLETPGQFALREQFLVVLLSGPQSDHVDGHASRR